METVSRSRSESPFTRSKVKDHENGTENGKGKKMNKTKQKCQQNDVDGEDFRTREKNDVEEAKKESDHDINDSDRKIANGNGNGLGMENGHQEAEKVANNNGLINNYESEEVRNGDFNEMDENKGLEERAEEERVEETLQGTEEEELIITETENCAKNDTTQDDLSENGEAVKEETEKVSNGETDNVTREEEDTEVGSTMKNASEDINSNGSESGSHYEDAHSTKDDGQLSKDGAFLSSKLSSFWGKWNSSFQEEKKDAETSSLKIVKEMVENHYSHPYLSKVSGRRGIRERFNLRGGLGRDEGRTTPDVSGINLDDSFRVRTDPPRFNSSGLVENQTLKKYKGKRCLNASDDPEEEEEDGEKGVGVLSSTKRRKLDKSDESGLLGGLLWSPFKKKPKENENELKMSAAESKITKFLSPFWFWKKLASGQK